MSSENAGSSTAPAQGSEVSVAQQLLQKHAEPHAATVEEVVDEDLPSHSAAPESSAAAGKQKESSAPKAPLDTKSHELFPELGAPNGKSANVAPIWGAKSNAGRKANDAASNGVSRSSTPTSGAATPAQSTAPSMFIPGRNVESVTLEPQFITPRSQLKRPIPDIIKDINRKSRANITMTTSSNGKLKFDATGPQEVAQQALKDLVQQIGTRVCVLSSVHSVMMLIVCVDLDQGSDS